MRTLIERVLSAVMITINLITAEAVLSPISPLLAGVVVLAFAVGALAAPVMEVWA